MHAFALAETVLVILVAIENLVVYETNKRWNRKEAIIANFKRATADSKGKRALSVIEHAAKVRIAKRATRPAARNKVVPAPAVGALADEESVWASPAPPEASKKAHPPPADGAPLQGATQQAPTESTPVVAAFAPSPVPSPPPSPPMLPCRGRGTRRGAAAAKPRRRAAHSWRRVVTMRLRAVCDRPLDAASRWASQQLDGVSLVLMPCLYAQRDTLFPATLTRTIAEPLSHLRSPSLPVPPLSRSPSLPKLFPLLAHLFLPVVRRFTLPHPSRRYAVTLMWSFERAFDGFRLADLLSSGAL